MKQGTVSVLIGCHSPATHGLFVLLSWRRLYGRWPAPWQAACIAIHDVGHWGTDYLTNLPEKRGHWRRGARWALRLFGRKGYRLVAGHCEYSGFRRSELYKPDKYSWYLAPTPWIYWNDIVEPEIRHGLPRRESVRRFKAQVQESIESGAYRNTHEMYLERLQEDRQRGDSEVR